MSVRYILAAVLVLAATPALAFECPSLMAEVDAALSSASLSAEDRARVEELRDEGEALHAAGEHSASVERLNAAKEILGL